jgi:hypothetical protein
MSEIRKIVGLKYDPGEGVPQVIVKGAGAAADELLRVRRSAARRWCTTARSRSSPIARRWKRRSGEAYASLARCPRTFPAGAGQALGAGAWTR